MTKQVLLTLILLLSSHIPAYGSLKGEWQTWVAQRDHHLKTGVTSFLNLNDAAYLEKGQKVFLSKNFPRNQQKFLKQNPENPWVQIQWDGARVLLSYPPQRGSINLLEHSTWKLKGSDLVLKVNRLDDGAVRVRLHNPKNPILKKFSGLRYFKFNPAEVVDARFERLKNGRSYTFTTVRNRKSRAQVLGRLHFKIHGKSQTLTAYGFPDEKGSMTELFVPFRDQTNGESTFAGGRYLDVPLTGKTPSSGQSLRLNFNLAYNPLCARSKHFNCVRVPGRPMNVEIRAGERTPH